MSRTPVETCSVTELRRNPSACIATAKRNDAPLFITRRGTVIAVLMTIEQYQFMRDETNAFADFIRSSTRSDKSNYRCYLEETHL